VEARELSRPAQPCEQLVVQQLARMLVLRLQNLVMVVPELAVAAVLLVAGLLQASVEKQVASPVPNLPV
jgi:hypothetical protein